PARVVPIAYPMLFRSNRGINRAVWLGDAHRLRCAAVAGIFHRHGVGTRRQTAEGPAGAESSAVYRVAVRRSAARTGHCHTARVVSVEDPTDLRTNRGI